MGDHVEVLVVGSGPGGSVTARECARAGGRVLVIEEGPLVEPGAHAPFSLAQTRAQYRGQGLTVALGRPAVAYTEGRCAGGGSEVNSGLYHRPPAGLLDEWSRRFDLEGLDAEILAPFHRLVEERLGVGPMPDGVTQPSSDVLRRGAERLGWRGVDVPRWVTLERSQDDRLTTRRNTMLRTYLRDALDSGAELRTDTRVDQIVVDRGAARGAVVRDGRTGRTTTITADSVVVAAGAIHTPTLLQRSGIHGSGHVGRHLAMHPTVKAVGHFEEEVVNDPQDVGAYQVKEFDPWLTMGASASGPALLSLQLAENAVGLADYLREWPHLGSFYAAITSRGTGRVRAVPGRRDPLVTYTLTRSDLAALRSGLARLTHLLLAAGACGVLPTFAGAPVVTHARDVPEALEGFGRQSASLMTVHLMGTSRMGEDPERSVTDSWGRVHGIRNLRVNDASLIPSAPGVNPQGTVLAIAHRNVEEMLSA